MTTARVPTNDYLYIEHHSPIFAGYLVIKKSEHMESAHEKRAEPPSLKRHFGENPVKNQASQVKIEPVAQRGKAISSVLLEIWEASVSATHDFLTVNDIQGLKPVVYEAIQGIETLVTAKNEHGIAAAFMGVERDKIEMLFVVPQMRGKGIGRRLLSYAVNELNARYVDVNEQNPQAEGFYGKMGFEVFGRSELDAQGNPYPLLHMRLKGMGVNHGR
jgi:putative acetyltransferase